MSQLKFYLTVLMYIYIVLTLIKSGNIIAIIFIAILGFSFIKTERRIQNFDVVLKKFLCRQREFFINSLSHDLRIPTIAQIRALQLVRNEKLGGLNEAQKEMLNQIEHSCKCILNLLSLMINTYSIENNSYRLIYEKINLSEIIKSCFDELSRQAAEKQITFEYDSEDKNLSISADKIELKKVIINILQNSISNASVGEKLSIKAASENSRVRLTFFSESKKVYYSNFTRESKYTSVGQSIVMNFCKRIIENHKGKIIENNNSDLFSFELPMYAV